MSDAWTPKIRAAWKSFSPRPLEIEVGRIEESGDPVETRRAQREWGAQARERLRSKLGPRSLTTLTHSGEWIVAIGSLPEVRPGAQPGARMEGLGVDLERTDREVSIEALKRFQAAGEHALPLGPIDLWVIKEACFKANPENEGSVVSQYRVTAYLPAGSPWEISEGFARHERAGKPLKVFRFMLVQLDGWTLAVAECGLSDLSDLGPAGVS